MNWQCCFLLLAGLLSGGGLPTAPLESQLRAFVQEAGLPVPEMKGSTLGGGMVLLKARDEPQSLTLHRKLAKSDLNLKNVLVVSPLFKPRSTKNRPGLLVTLHLPNTVQQGEPLPFTFELTNRSAQSVEGNDGMCAPDLQIIDPSSGWVIDHTSHNRPCPMGLQHAKIKAGAILRVKGMWVVGFANQRPLPSGNDQVQAALSLTSGGGQKGWVLSSQQVNVLVKTP